MKSSLLLKLNTIFVLQAYEHLIPSCESGHRNCWRRSHIPHSRIGTKNQSGYPCYMAILRAKFCLITLCEVAVVAFEKPCNHVYMVQVPSKE